MTAPREMEFTLPIGYADGDGAVRRTARCAR